MASNTVIVRVVVNELLLDVSQVVPSACSLEALFRQLVRENRDRRGFPCGSEALLLDRCKYFVLDPPIQTRAKDDAVIVAECQESDEHRRRQVRSRDTLDDHVNNIHKHFVHFLFKVDSPEEKAITKLRNEYAELFKCLQIVVTQFNNWTEADVRNNLGGGAFYSQHDLSPEPFRSIQNDLKQRRLYGDLSGPDLNQAKCYHEHFDQYFSQATGGVGPSVEDTREFVSFYNLHRCWLADAPSMGTSLKCSTFSVYFAIPPFLSCSGNNIRFQMETTWQFPLFISSNDRPDVFFKLTPRSDFGVVDPVYLCPLVISETISQRNESDRWRMLIQAIAMARSGHFLMKSGTDERFFVVAIYLRSTLIAQRYIVMQTSAGEGNPVSVVEESFDLTDATQSTKFLLEMFNLTAKLSRLMQHLDPAKRGMLLRIKKDATGLRSLTSTPRSIKQSMNTGTMAPVPEESVDDHQEDLGIFGTEEIQEKLKAMKYRFDFRVFGHPNLASITSISDPPQPGYLKFVDQGQNEVAILEYLSSIDSPSNHTINGIRIWHISDGAIIYMPVAGCWLTSLNNPNDKLWSVAKQLVEGVDFMHSHGVAHMDIKPGNLIIPPQGGRLSIIDYNRSVQLTGRRDAYRGIVGTKGYIAPEVLAGSGLWSALRADLWSAGKTLQDLCMRCDSSAPGREALLTIARRLMKHNPTDRPMMSEVLQWMAQCEVQSNPSRGTFQLGLERSMLQEVNA